MTKRIALIPGDGIGREVVAGAERALETLVTRHGLPLDWTTFDWGAEKYLCEGVTLPEGALEMLHRDFHAILLGAMGDPRVPSNQHAVDILLGIRFGLDLYVNQRPAKLLDGRLCPLRGFSKSDINFVICRENTEGAYAGVGGNFKRDTVDEVAVQEDVNTRRGVERILVYAFEYARRRGLKKLCMSDKANAMPYGHGLWQRTFTQVQERFPEVEARHLYIDTLATEMVRNPSQFQVIVTCNLFGDILSDLAAALVGGLGVAPSANLNPGRISMFEPVHGSAPNLAGKNIANPMGAILSLGMMLEELGFSEESTRIAKGVADAIHQGISTPDLGGSLGTCEVAQWICTRL
jgi:3-isopropylmalate dehydrogenase